MENEKRICAHCGCVIEDDNLHEFEGEYYCEDCFEELFDICEHCGDVVWRHNMSEVITRTRWPRNDTEIWCGYCVDRHAETCAECGALFSEDEYLTRDVEGYGNVCENCLDNNFWWCEECEEYHRNNCNCPHEKSERIFSYHAHHYERRHFYGVGKLFLGIELEVDTDDHDSDRENAFLDGIESAAGDRLYFESDGSLHNGFEIISEPHTPKALIEEIDWKSIMQCGIDNDYSSHDIGTCGLHVHINRDFFGDDSVSQTRGIAKMIYFYERWFPEVVKFSRRNSNQIYSWAGRYGVDTIEECIKLAKGECCLNRYHCVNLTNSATVEIRVMRGTLRYETFAATIDFVSRIARNAAKIGYKEIDNLRCWLRGMSKETLEYMHHRGCFGM